MKTVFFETVSFGQTIQSPAELCVNEVEISEIVNRKSEGQKNKKLLL